MTLTERLIAHDAWMTRRLLERASEIDGAELDSPLPNPQRPLPFEQPEPTLRRILERLVATKEMWVAAVRRQKPPGDQDTSVDGMMRRKEAAFADFTAIVRDVAANDRWDETFVDEMCAPPETFTYGGMIAHVITFSAYRRLVALKALEAAGVRDLGYGDPIEWERSRDAAGA